MNHQERLVGVYYFRGGMFTCVPHHLCAEFDDMAEQGTNIVCMAVNDRDLAYNDTNLGFMIEEIHRRGMQVYFVPSRVAGVTAGAPLTADGFGYRYPHTWTINEDGTPLVRGNGMGVVGSFYHPEVEELFVELVGRMVTEYPVDGIIWDEPKWTNWQDFSAKAREHNPEADFRIYMRDMARCFSRINARLKAKRPELTIVHFDEACRSDIVVEESAKVEHLDYFGTDGHPWPAADSSRPVENKSEFKTLFHYGERYLKAARANGVKTFALIENMKMDHRRCDLFERHIEQVLAMDVDLLLYYYYGRYGEALERNMRICRRYIGRSRDN